MTTAGAIQVDKLRTVFFWPLVLEFPDDLSTSGPANRHRSVGEILNEQFEKLAGDQSPWQLVTDTLKHLGDDASPEDSYGEYVFFHDFLQKTLFGSRSTPHDNHPLMLLRRTDIERLDVRFEHGWSGGKPLLVDVSTRVERLNLYLLRPGIAVMALQVETTSPHDLATLLRFNDIMRRSHLPYFDNGYPASQRPHAVTFGLSNGKMKTFDTNEDIGLPSSEHEAGRKEPGDERKIQNIADTLCAMPPDKRKLPAYSHWRWLLDNGVKECFHFDADFPGKTSWRHFSDERLPLLVSFVLATRNDYYKLGEGDWHRIAFVDPPGSDPTPYAAEFLRAQFQAHAYDRYHHPKAAIADAPVRYFMCDYAMTAVTYRHDTRVAYRRETTGDENTYAKVIEMHMQRHYYQMFLLAVIDKSVMLNISSRISHAVEVYDRARSDSAEETEAEDRLMGDMEEINRDFLHYVHRFRFTGISGQLQPSEMYAKLRSVMNLDALFDDIRTELDTAVNFLSGRSEKRGAEATERLGIIATVALVLGLVMTFFSMNIITDSEVLLAGVPDDTKMMKGVGYLLKGIGIASAVALVMISMMAQKRAESFVESRFYPRITQAILLVFAAVGLGVGFSFF